MKILWIILGLATAVASPGCKKSCNAHFGARTRQEEALRHDLFEIRKAIDDYHEDKGRWPESLDDLKRSKYLRSVPKDPITGNSSSWILVRQGQALYDVRSGANGRACDGRSYATW